MRLHHFRQKIYLALMVAISSFLCVSAADSQNKTTPKTVAEKNNKTANELDRIATGMTPNTRKIAVVKRLAALFRGNANPIVKTKKFVPAKPYIAMHDIISKDPLVPDRTMIIYRLRFALANSKTQDAIEGLVGEAGTVEISEKQNLVIINVLKNRAEAIKEALIAMDQPTPQILVETQIIEVAFEQGEDRDVQVQYTQTDSHGNKDVYGFNLTTPGQNVNTSQSAGVKFSPISQTSIDGSSKQLDIALNWLQNSTDSKILAAPNIIAELGTDAKMTTGEEIPYSEAAITSAAVSQNIKFKKTGVNLTIKPVIINEDTVRLEIKPEIIMAVRYQTFTTSSGENSTSTSVVPVVSIRNISTTLTAADGEIIMLGGLYSSERTEQLRKTPYLSDLPVIGDLFAAKSSTVYDKQLIFFMKIHILKTPYSVMSDPEQNAAVIQDIGHALRDSNTLFQHKKPAEVLDQQTTFSWDIFKNPRAVLTEYFGTEAGEEKRPAPRQLGPVRTDTQTPSAETPAKGN